MRNYNRLILIGNGLDLALGLKTSYKDFVFEYLKRLGIELLNSQQYELTNKLISFVNKYHKNQEIIVSIENCTSLHELLALYSKNSIIVRYNSLFFEQMAQKTNLTTWVDFEAEYYENLNSCFMRLQKIGWVEEATEQLKVLNQSMDAITEALKEHILLENCAPKKWDLKPTMRKFAEKFHATLHPDEYEIIWGKKTERHEPDEVLFLNFNYTNTTQNLINLMQLKSSRVINIHGNVSSEDNPIIFGYGDDTDDSYPSMEKFRNDELLRKMKTFHYPKTHNYHNLLGFLNSENYEVFVVGHSCGLSDKTLLNSIFEHPHCKAIKNFHYHEDAETEDFYKRMAIARNFSSKQLFRNRVLPFDSDAKIPQVTR